MLYLSAEELNTARTASYDPRTWQGVTIVPNDHGDVHLTPDGLRALAVITGQRVVDRDQPEGQGTT